MCLLSECSDLISSLHRQGQARDRKKTSGLSVGIAITKSSPSPKDANIQHPKAANTIPESTCPFHLSTPAPETSRKVSTVEDACPQPPNFQPPYLSTTYLHPYLLHPSIMSDKNHVFCAFMDVVTNSSTLRACSFIYKVHSRIIQNLLDEYYSHQLSRTRQEK